MSERVSAGRSGRGRTHNELIAIVAAGVLVLILAVGAWFAVSMVSDLTDHADEGTYLSNISSRLDSLVAKAGEAENEHRAYLNTGDPARLKAFNESAGGIQVEFEELLKLTEKDPGLQGDLLAGKAAVQKKVESLRDAIDYQRIGQSSHASALLAEGGIATTVNKAIAPLQQRFAAAITESRKKPRDVAAFTGYWLLVTWLLAAAAGIGIAVLAIGQARAVGRLHRRLRRESIHDGLTGLANNVYLEEWLARTLSRATRAGGKVGLVYVDINNFKQVNHSLGHGEGDRVLIEVAEKLGSITRKSDFVARIRNDSFAIVMADVRDLQQVESAMRRFGALGITRAGIAIRITAGCALFPDDAETPDNLLRLSRAAMYRNRQTRRAA